MRSHSSYTHIFQGNDVGMLPVSQEDFDFLGRVSLALVNNLHEYRQALATTGWGSSQDRAKQINVWSAAYSTLSIPCPLPSVAISSRKPPVASMVLCPQTPKFMSNLSVKIWRSHSKLCTERQELSSLRERGEHYFPTISR